MTEYISLSIQYFGSDFYRNLEHLYLPTSVRNTSQIYLVLLLNWLKFCSYTGSRFHYYRPVFRVRWYPRHFGFGWRSTRLFTHKWPIHHRAKSWMKKSRKTYRYNAFLPRLTYISPFWSWSYLALDFFKSVLFHLAASKLIITPWGLDARLIH